MKKNLVLKISAILSAISGIIILTAVFFPIASYQGSGDSLISPLVTEDEATGTVPSVDYTKASNWFIGGAKEEDFTTSKVSFYTLSIPKLGIDSATVSIGGEDLSKYLVHYPGTALPGKAGNAVLFGHSVLPIFYNPKNYMTIFSTIPTLKPGDEIDVNYDGVSYVYKVESLKEVFPTDTNLVLAQDKSDSFLTLVTCIPPGDPRNPKRLLVKARIVPPL